MAWEESKRSRHGRLKSAVRWHTGPLHDKNFVSKDLNVKKSHEKQARVALRRKPTPNLGLQYNRYMPVIPSPLARTFHLPHRRNWEI